MKLRVPAIFTDYMVIQRDKPFIVWGWAQKNRPIKGVLEDQVVKTISDDHGKWQLVFPARKKGDNLRLTIFDLNTTLQFNGIAVGEVWLASGQSNMELPLCDSLNGKQVVSNYQGNKIRYYNVPRYSVEDDMLDELESNTSWKQATAANLGDMSAVAYYFASEIVEKEDTIVGIIGSYYGGTSITCWMSEDKLANSEAGRTCMEEYQTLIGDKTEEQYQEEMKAYNTSYQVWLERVEERRRIQPDVTWEILNEECGICPWPQPAGSQSPFRPHGLFDTMLSRIVPYSIKGVLWYQGEEDVIRHKYYSTLLQDMILEWRYLWDESKLPFLLVQLPMYISKMDDNNQKDDLCFAYLREQQAFTALQMSDVGMAVMIDGGEYDNIHPLDKETVGKRLSLQALEKVYRKSIKSDSPFIDRLLVEECNVVLTIKNAEVLISGAEEIVGFQMAGVDNVFYPADAKINGTQIILRSNSVKVPVNIRYAFTNYQKVGIYNEIGLPLSPYRTDGF